MLTLAGSRPGSTDGDGYHLQQPAGPAVGPKIRALQNQLKLTDINDTKGSLV